MRNAGMNLHQVVVVGCGRALRIDPAQDRRLPHLFRRCGAAYNATPAAGQINTRVPVFEQHEAFVNYVRAQQVHEVWLALPPAGTHDPQVRERVPRRPGERALYPDVRSLALFESGVTDLLGETAINLVASPALAERAVAEGTSSIACSRLVRSSRWRCFSSIAPAVKVSSRGPVFFKQRRKGARAAASSRSTTFRSMRLHAEQAESSIRRRATTSRVTRVGAFLRRTSMDELLQFFNVLRGDMSVMSAKRPHALEHDDLHRKVVSGYIHRYRIKPGITGWAQVNGFRGETDRGKKMEGRVAHDLYYLGNWSFGLDMRIIVATIFKGLRHTNAY